MDRHASHHLPVVDGGELVGMLLDRDLAMLESIPGMVPTRVEVARLMTPALSVSSNTPIDEAVALMTENRVDCAAVRGEHGGIIGLLTSARALAGLARRAYAAA